MIAPRAWLLALAAAAAACGPGPTRVGGQPHWRKVEATHDLTAPRVVHAEVTFVPSSPPAARYNDPPLTAAPPSPLGDAIVAAFDDVAAALRLDPPLADGRLFAAAGELAAVVPAEGVVPYALVEFAMQHHGIIEPSPHLLVIWGPLDDAGAIVDQLRPRIGDLLAGGARARLGVGAHRARGGHDGIVVVALQYTAITTRPIPRALPEGGVIRLDGEIAAGYRDPEVYVTQEDGAVVRARTSSSGRTFQADVDCARRTGRLQIEVTAVDATGSTVLANFPVWCRAEAPDRITIGPSEDDLAPVATEAEAERRMLELVNRDRGAAGLPPLAWDEQVAEVARAHSREMRVTGLVAHVSPTTGSASDRIRAAGIRTAAVLENIARAYGVAEAQAGLMNSPGHRANLLSRQVTHVGVGIVFGDEVAGRREMFVTQVFTRVTPPIDRAAVTAQVRKAIGDHRTLAGDDALDRIAAELAAGLAAGEAHRDASARASKQLEAHAGRYRRVGSVVTTVADVDGLDVADLVGDQPATHVGIGIAQGSHVDLGEGAVFIVLLLAVAR